MARRTLSRRPAPCAREPELEAALAFLEWALYSVCDLESSVKPSPGFSSKTEVGFNGGRDCTCVSDVLADNSVVYGCG